MSDIPQYVDRRYLLVNPAIWGTYSRLLSGPYGLCYGVVLSVTKFSMPEPEWFAFKDSALNFVKCNELCDTRDKQLGFWFSMHYLILI